MDDLLQRGSNWVLHGELNNVGVVTDAGGGSDEWCDYEPWGQMTARGYGSPIPYQFTGREADESGLMYYRARYYNPSWGRFVSEGPIGFEGGTNLYAYCGDNPVGAPDPSGEISPNNWYQDSDTDPTASHNPSYTPQDVLDGWSALGPALSQYWENFLTLLIEQPMIVIPDDLPASKRAAIRQQGLPYNGPFRYVPPDRWKPTNPLPRGPGGGFLDKWGNEWQRGAAHHFPGEAYEWDVQLKGGGYYNVSRKGQFR